jgi:hypothetical protein
MKTSEKQNQLKRARTSQLTDSKNIYIFEEPELAAFILNKAGFDLNKMKSKENSRFYIIVDNTNPCNNKTYALCCEDIISNDCYCVYIEFIPKHLMIQHNIRFVAR